MAETKITIPSIQKLQVKGKVAEIPIEGGEKGETEKVLMTSVSFEYEGAPGKFDSVLWAMMHEAPIDVIFASPQSQFDSITFKAGDQEVTITK